MAEIIFNLPTDDNIRFDYNFQKTLEGVTYDFNIKYIARSDSYILDVNPNVKGINIVYKDDLLANFHSSDGVPPGKLVLHDFDGLKRDPSRDTFPSRITLKYIETE